METDERYADWLAGFRALLEASPQTQEEFGRKVGKSREHINSILNNRKRAGEDLQDAISRALGMSYDDVRTHGREKLGKPLRVAARQTLHLQWGSAENVEEAQLPEWSCRVPVISFVQAGNWATAVDNFHPGDAEEWVHCSPKYGPRSFGLRVKGPSMEPEFREGEIIIVDPEARAESGDFVVAKNGDEEATFKRYLYEDGRHYLMPLNDKFDHMDMTGKEWRIVGRVVGKMKNY